METLSLLPSAATGHRENKQVVINAFSEGSSTPVLDAVEAVARPRKFAKTQVDSAGSSIITMRGDVSESCDINHREAGGRSQVVRGHRSPVISHLPSHSSFVRSQSMNICSMGLS